MGRPLLEDEPLFEKVTAKIGADMYRRLRQLSERTRVPMAVFVREAIEAMLKAREAPKSCAHTVRIGVAGERYAACAECGDREETGAQEYALRHMHQIPGRERC